MGLRPAEPGEFSRRAYLGGKMDLIEAEGLADLIAAETPAQKEQALRQMGGSLSGYYHELRQRILVCLAHLEAYIDFPDEEIPDSVIDNLAAEREGIVATIDAALADHRRGERLREGVRVVILGAPNSGKSSLLNALSGKEAAIVSTQAGTTRDAIEVHMNLGGFPLILTDTAGLREAGDEIEEEGIRRAKARAEEADLRLVLFDAQNFPQLDRESRELINDETIVLFNKSDISARRKDKLNIKNKYLFISARTGEGLEELINTLKEKLIFIFSGQEAPIITRTRHRALLKEARSALMKFSADAPLELACEELRTAAREIGKITGQIQVDDVLEIVFRQFCIGK
jgi:tRNA modification GTPase